jgi:hypothetical protein
MNPEEKEKAAREARERSERCWDWQPLMRPGLPKPATKDELFALANEGGLCLHRWTFPEA